MRYSRLFGKTYKFPSSKKKDKAWALLVQGGYFRSLGKGLFSFLPLGMKVYNRLKKIIRDELYELGGEEVLVPVVNPYSLWEASGRANLIDDEMLRFKDRTGKSYILSPTHEEAFVELARTAFTSYKDLPFFLFQFQTKFRDEERPRASLLRSKEFIMNDGYSFHKSYSDLNNFFPKIHAAYNNIFATCHLDVISAESTVGFMGGSKAYEFLSPSDNGKDLVLTCPNCGYSAKKKLAVGAKNYHLDDINFMSKIATPGAINMAKLADFFELPKYKLAKCMLFKGQSKLVMAVVRGDYGVSLHKLSEILGENITRKATKEEVIEQGLIPGYFSPINLSTDIDVTIIIDESIANTPNLVFGANEEGHSYLNTNFGVDFSCESVYDITEVKAGDRCLHCGSELEEVRCLEVGNIFKLDDFYTSRMDLTFQDDTGKVKHPYMGSYGIGMGRLIQAVVDKNRDDKGIVWPWYLAPFKVYLISIGKSKIVKELTEEIIELIGDDVLYDDRDESVGIKFRDAELLGIPLRIVVSKRYIEDEQVEFCTRRERDKWLVDKKHIIEEYNIIKKRESNIK
ncbi:MAG: proline--tRNA ligase [Spirochaetaceae bacterium 4572_7]|nr:MAG: proline--tRNA ligase [Spirochaetaceae bacterium 4572_7]